MKRRKQFALVLIAVAAVAVAIFVPWKHIYAPQTPPQADRPPPTDTSQTMQPEQPVVPAPPLPVQPEVPDIKEQPSPPIIPPVTPAPVDDAMDAAAVAALLTQHWSAYTRGAFAECSAIEAKLAKARPLGRFAPFVDELGGARDFGFRARLLALAAGDDRDMVWSVLMREFWRYQKDGASNAWDEHESSFLRALAATIAPDLWRYERGLGILEEILLGPQTEEFRCAVLTSCGTAQASAHSGYLPVFRRVLREGDSEALRREAARMMLRFSPDRSAREALLLDESARPFLALLLGDALTQGWLPKEEILLRARELFQRPDTQNLDALYAVLEATDGDAMLNIGRELFIRHDINAALYGRVLDTLLARGTRDELEIIVTHACGAHPLSREAAQALYRSGKTERVAEVFERSQSVTSRAVALRLLAEGPQRSTWLDRALASAEPETVRVAAASLLNASNADERIRLQALATEEKSVVVRERALKALGAARDISLKHFFEMRAAADKSTTLRVLARGYAEELERLERSKKR